MLALAYRVERLVEAGELTGYAEAARALGLTRARLTQVMNLALLAPEIQEQVLVETVSASERRLRAVVAEPCWTAQTAIARGVEPELSGSEASRSNPRRPSSHHGKLGAGAPIA